jgi:hypothetical protein
MTKPVPSESLGEHANHSDQTQEEMSARDMSETPDELAKWPALAVLLKYCEEIIRPAFQDADSAAKKHQKTHKLLTKLAAIFGTTAVLFAIVQLAFLTFHKTTNHEETPHLLIGLEVLAAVAALVAVVLGGVSLRLAHWIVERHKAERLRLIKFRFLIDPIVWSANKTTLNERVEHLKKEVESVKSVTVALMREEINKENPFNPPPQPEPSQAISTQILTELVDYYREKRLLFQRNYFREKIDHDESLDALTRRLSPILFFGSVLAALAHFGCHLSERLIHIHEFKEIIKEIGLPFTFLAIALPTFAGGIRTFRSANEFARNGSRYRAREKSLSSLNDILTKEQDHWSKMCQIWYCEVNLEFEHREWCRLMMETEWFG